MKRLIIQTTILFCLLINCWSFGNAQEPQSEENIEWIEALKEGLDKAYPVQSPYDPELHREQDINTGKELGSSIFDPKTLNEYELENLDVIRNEKKQRFIQNIVIGISLIVILLITSCFIYKKKRKKDLILNQ